MKCPKCNSEIDERGIIWHMKKIHGENIEGMLGILFEEILDLKEKYSHVWGKELLEETREVKFINGPLKGKILTLSTKTSKIVFPMLDKKGYGSFEYEIRRDENGQWIGE